MNALPGVNPIFHEGKISGTFDLASSDMAQVEYGGRLVLVLVADVVNLNVKDVKGDQTAFWTFKGADAAIVRDQGMKDHLAKTLSLAALDPDLFDEDNVTRGPTLVGMYNDEGTFLGFEEEEDSTDGTILLADDDEDDYEEEEEIEVDPETGEIKLDVVVGAPTVTTGPAPHIRHRDPALEAFLNGEPANV